MFTRNALYDLKKWKESRNRKPLVIRGARQVGKTTLVKLFSVQFSSFIYLNLEKPADRRYFDSSLNVRQIVRHLVNEGYQVTPGSTLLFIDEIQNSPDAVQALRYFYEELPEIHVIAAGSLLERLFMQGKTFPVGRVEYLTLRPCAFDEFLGANGLSSFAEQIRACDVPLSLHQKLLPLFNDYMYVGGLPDAINAYTASQGIYPPPGLYEDLLTAYLDDVEKYSSVKQLTGKVLLTVLQRGWHYAASRITFTNFANTAFRSREVSAALKLLEQVFLLELVYPVCNVNPPPEPDYRKRPKLLWFDTGLVCHAAKLFFDPTGFIWDQDLNVSFRGSITEHVIGQELIAHETRPLTARYFWVREARNSSAEVDFLFLSERYGLIPIEVKSGTNAHLKSLHLFMENASAPVAVRFWPKPLQVDEIELKERKFKLISAPYYFAGSMDSLLRSVMETRGQEL